MMAPLIPSKSRQCCSSGAWKTQFRFLKEFLIFPIVFDGIYCNTVSFESFYCDGYLQIGVLEHLLSISRTSVAGLLADRDGPHLTFKILLLVQCSDGHAWSSALWRFDRACDRMRGILSTTQPNSHTLYYSSIPKRNDRRKVSYLNTKPVYLKPVNSLWILIVMSEFGN